MDTIDLTSIAFWESDTCEVMVNDRDVTAVAQAEVLRKWCRDNDGLEGHLLFSTSGSTGGGKWVALSRGALLASARAVNEHLQVSCADRWLLALPTFHVGGMGVIARAYLTSCGLSFHENVWDVKRFHEALGDGITLTSLVPTQLADIVSGSLESPDSLRAVLIGGGALDDAIYQKSVSLGWPIVETYGMTEASSQIATAGVTDRKLKVLPCWQTKTDDRGNLCIKGEPMLTSYLRVEEGEVVFEPVPDDGWFVTSDRVEIEAGTLVFKGRADRCVKVLGELIDLASVESQLQNLLGRNLLGRGRVAVVAVPDQRRGNRLVAFVEKNGDMPPVCQILDAYHRVSSPVARVESISYIDELPRTAIGKICYSELINDETSAE